MQNYITISKIEHAIKVALWKSITDFDYNESLPWKFMFFCGSNLLCSANTRDELTRKMKESKLELYPKIIYTPPQRSRKNWFDESFQLDEKSLQLEYESSVTCIGPVTGNIIGVETYEFSPWQLSYMGKYELKEAFYEFLLCAKRIQIKTYYVFTNNVLKIIWNILRKTTNTGFHTI